MSVIQNGVGITTLLNGETVKQALNPANETVGRGIYVATTLSAVDADLASANIKNGITIFGFAGDADVWDISDATAVEAEVIVGETFYAVAGGIRTGTMPIETLIADNNAYPAGYHVGAANLAAIDASLAAANIRSGVNIFGYIGVATVQEIGAANAILSDVKNGRTFFSVTGGIKTGNLATVALAAGANAYPQGYHVGAANLTAVDGDLVAGNIADGVTIFGVLGTLAAGALAEDITDEGKTAINSTSSGAWFKTQTVNAGAGVTIATVTPTFADPSMTVGVASLCCNALTADRIKMQCVLGGVVVAESVFIGGIDNYTAVGTRALVGAQVCLARVWNSSGTDTNLNIAGRANNERMSGIIGVGSIKLV